MTYHWPGNIRQLKNMVERLYVADKDRVIHASELPLEIIATDPIRGSFRDRVKAYEKSLLLGALKDADGKPTSHRAGCSREKARNTHCMSRRYKGHASKHDVWPG